ncbi:hypothetical protein N7449_000520 [Penicillium cf. viridicatum]|uniref:Uncharacterized protein n=1 Tax=Penicillium cf. viridicatum TaxID=2972119 RepID=A0A9W9T8L1_9EURO|nr:hypothetical protein N7449_000520 [Penicillium cf. viridicatum]
MGATSLFVIARKATERVVAQLDGDEGGWRASNRSNETSLSVNTRRAAERVVTCFPLTPILSKTAWLNRKVFLLPRSNVSVCEHAKGSRTCVVA